MARFDNHSPRRAGSSVAFLAALVLAVVAGAPGRLATADSSGAASSDAADAEREVRRAWVQALVAGADARFRAAPHDAAEQAARRSVATGAKRAAAGTRVESVAQRLDAQLADGTTPDRRGVDALRAQLRLAEAALAETGTHLDTRRLGNAARQRWQVARDRLTALRGDLDAAAASLGSHSASSKRAGIRALRDVLDRLAAPDTRSVLGARPLPLRRLALAAPPPTGGPFIVPSYLDPAVTGFDPDDLTGSDATPLHPDIVAQARELDFEYTRIVDFVRTQVRTEWYLGSHKGALGTLRSRAGNDADQAALLVALLRASGVPARFVAGTALVDLDDIGTSLGLTQPSAIVRALHRAGVPHRPRSQGGAIGQVELDHVWVSARVPYSNLRGAAIEASGPAWLPFAPAIKRHVARPASGAPAAAGLVIPALIEQHLSAPRALSPLAALRAVIEQHLTGQGIYADQLRALVPPEQPLDLLPASLPMAVLAVRQESPDLPAEDHGLVTVRVRGEAPVATSLLTLALPLAEVAQGRLTLTYQPATVEDQATVNAYGSLAATPAYLVHVRPRVQVDGQLRAVGEPLPLGIVHTLEVEVATRTAAYTAEQRLVSGAVVAIVPAPVGAAAAPENEGEVQQSQDEPLAGRVLANLARRYVAAWDRDLRELADLYGVAAVQPLPSLAFALTQLKVERAGDIALSIAFDGIGLDAAARIVEPVLDTADPAAERDWLELLAVQGAFLEQAIFEQQWATQALSADQGLALAREQGIALRTLWGPDGTAVLPTLDHPPAVREAVQALLVDGYEVLLPERELALEHWRGSVWRARDGAGAVGYYVSGGLAGGITVLPPAYWYLEDLADLLIDPYATPPNDDPLAGIHIALSADAQDQIGIVDTVLDTPLTARLLDVEGRPVAGATVRFVVTAGGGSLLSAAGDAELLEVITDRTGTAMVQLRLGRRFQLATFLHEPGAAHPQRVGYNEVEVVAGSRLGWIASGEPYRAHARPGAPQRLRFLRRSNTLPPAEPPLEPALWWTAGIGYLDYVVQAVDEYDNPVANLPLSITTDWTPPTHPDCPDPDLDGAIAPGVFASGACPAGRISLTGDPCAPPTLATSTGPLGTAFHVVPGNVMGSRIALTVSAPGVAELTDSVRLRGDLQGNCNVAGHFDTVFAHVIHDVLYPDGFNSVLYGTSIEAAPPGQLLPVPRRLIAIEREPGPGPIRDWTPVPALAAQFTLSDDAEATPLVPVEPGVFEYNVRLGDEPARVQGVVEVDTGEIVGQFPFQPVFGVRATIVGADPTPVPLSAVSTTAEPFWIRTKIEPDTYLSGPARLRWLGGNETIAETVLSNAAGEGGVYIGRGHPIDTTVSHRVEYAINEGTPYRIEAAPVSLPFGGDVIGGYGAYYGATASGWFGSQGHLATLVTRSPGTVVLKHEVDVSNQRVCAAGARFAFLLSQAATVRLGFTGLMDGQPVGAELFVPLDGEALPAGVHEVDIRPGDLPFGDYRFELTAIAPVTGDAETAAGTLIHQPERRETLSLAHSFVKGVDLFDGHAVISQEDLAVPGRGPQLKVIRTYASHNGDEPSGAGLGWSLNYDSQLIRTPCDEIVVTGSEGGGMRFAFDRAGDGGTLIYRALLGHHGSLIVQADGAADFYGKDGTRHHYGTASHRGRLLDFIEDTSGNRLTLTREQLGTHWPVVRATDAGGRSLTFTHRQLTTALGESMVALASVVGPDGLRVDYEYDAHGNLASVTRPGAPSPDRRETYSYTDFGSVTAAGPGGEPRGYRLGWRLTQARNAVNGATRTYQYALGWSGVAHEDETWLIPEQRVETLAEPDNGSWSFQYAGTRGLEAPVDTMVTNGRAFTSTHTLNGFGAAIAVSDPLGTTTTEWSLAAKQPSRITDAEGVTTTWTYDEHGNRTGEHVSGRGQPVSRSWTYVWPEFFAKPGIKNRVHTEIDYRGIITTYGYDGAGRRTQRHRGGVTETWGYQANGDLASSTDGNGHTTTYAHDSHGLPQTITHPDGTVRRLSHDARGRQTGQTDELGHTTTTAYDGLDRPVEIVEPATAAGQGRRTIQYQDASDTRIETDALNQPTTTVHDKQGRPRFIRDALDQERELRYDAHGNLVYERDVGGRVTTHAYDAGDRRTRTEAPEGLTTTWTHDATGHVLSQTVGEGDDARVTQWQYEHPLYHRTLERRAHEGGWVTTTFEPDGHGNVERQTDPLARVTQTTFDAFDRPTHVTAPLGKTSAYTYDGAGNRIEERHSLGGDEGEQVRGYVFDTRHRETERTDATGATWRSAYDAVGRVTRRTDPLGHASTTTYDALGRPIEERGPAAGQVTTTVYDLAGNAIQQTLPSGNLLTHVYDPLNRRTSTTDVIGPVETLTYTPTGQVATRTDGNGHVTTYTHDGLDRVTQEARPLNRTLSWTYTVHGEVRTQTDGEARTTTHAYDSLGRKTATTAPDGLGEESWTYDAVGNVETHTNPRGLTTTWTYNALDQRSGQLDPSPPGTTQSWTYDHLGSVLTHTDRRGIDTTTTYDGERRPLRVTRDGVLRQTLTYDAAGRQASQSDALGHTTFFDRDPAGRVLAERRPGGATATMTYTPADDIQSATDPDGVTTAYTYDVRRQRLSEQDGEGHTTTYAYDGNGNRTEVIKPGGATHTWTYAYDAANRLEAVTGPSGVNASYGYDRADNRTSQTDGNGHSTTFAYDALNRLTGITYPAIAGQAATETFELDGHGNVVAHGKGGVVTITAGYDGLDRKTSESFSPVADDGLTTIGYAHDGNGNLIQVTETFQTGEPKTSTYSYDTQDRLTARTDRHGRQLTYAYDAQGNRTRRTGPDGSVQYAYNARSQLAQVTPPGQGGIVVQPSLAGRLKGIQHGNGVTTSISHDHAGRLTTIAHTAGGGTVASATYVLDARGNRESETIQQGTQTRTITYGYDAADRLTRITAPEGETVYTLDGAGNRETEADTVGGATVGTKTYTHDARGQLTDIEDSAGPTQSFAYDAAGRQITKTVGAQTWTQGWSAKDRLLTLTLGAGPPGVRYDYDAQGQRTAREADGQRKQYVWDGLNLQAETNAVGNLLAGYTHAGRHALTTRQGSDRAHYHTDAQGTPLALTSGQGTVEVRYQTDAWGNEQAASATHPNPIGFTGYLKDPVTDDLYAQARQYSPRTGRFTSRDELRGDPLSPLSLHRFAYGLNNPTVWTDPTGRYAEHGHYYTVLLAAHEAGFEMKDALRLALYAQLPDHIGKLDAVNQATSFITTSQEYADSPSRPSWARGRGAVAMRHFGEVPTAEFFSVKTVHPALHVLNGERADTTTERAARVVLAAPTLEAAGIAMHALGDSFSHRRLDRESVMFPTRFGHGAQGSRPDMIVERPHLYAEYARIAVKTLAEYRGHPISDEQANAFASSMMSLVEGPAAEARKEIDDYIADYRHRAGNVGHPGYQQGLESRIKFFRDNAMVRAERAVAERIIARGQALVAREGGEGEILLRPEEARIGHFGGTSMRDARRHLDYFWEESFKVNPNDLSELDQSIYKDDLSIERVLDPSRQVINLYSRCKEKSCR